MKCSAVRNPNERWLIDLILLFIPSTAALETRILVHGRIRPMANYQFCLRARVFDVLIPLPECAISLFYSFI